MFVNEIVNFQVILTHILEKKLAKYYMGLKWTDKEGGIHLLEKSGMNSSQLGYLFFFFLVFLVK